MLSKLWFGDPVLIVWFIHERVCNLTLINQRKIQVSSINNKCEWFTRPDALQQVYITFSHSVSNKPRKARNVRQQLCVWPKQSEFPEAWNSSSWLMWPSLSQSNSSIVFSRNCVFLSFYGCYKMLLWNSLCKLYLDHGFCSLLLSLSLSLPIAVPGRNQKHTKMMASHMTLRDNTPNKNKSASIKGFNSINIFWAFKHRLFAHPKYGGSSLALRIKGAQLTRFWMPGWFLLGLWVWLKTGEWTPPTNIVT